MPQLYEQTSENINYNKRLVESYYNSQQLQKINNSKQMGIPRFYRWLKNKYPLIRFELNDQSKETPDIDNLYIDFNALVYRCLTQQGTFLRNKVKPLSFEEINQRVMYYLFELIENIKPGKLLFIALDGVAPRAKINQSRDRRFKGGKDSQQFKDLVTNAGIQDNQNFQQNSISPGTQFLFNLCQKLRRTIQQKVSTQWKNLNVMYSDCNCPGQGQHKIMDFLRYSKDKKLFDEDTTHCIYSPDADVILLSLGMQLKYICLIKQDTGVSFEHSSALTVKRSVDNPKFQLVMINILSQYLEKQFAEPLKLVPGSRIQDIINDFILLMAFVGNDFLPSEFCFTLKDNHMDNLYSSYKKYLIQNKKFINNKGDIDWSHVSILLQIATRFQANMIDEKLKNYKSNKNNPTYLMSKQVKSDQNGESQLEQYQVVDQKITKGKQVYYKSRFGLTKISHSQADPPFYDIIYKYIEGLEFYCKYYFQGLPSWNWFYPYHYTPLLADVQQYIQRNKVSVKLNKSQPFLPFEALMYMLPQSSFKLLPQPIATKLMDPNCQLRNPIDFYPLQFQIDKYQTLTYNKRALIPFLNEEDVKKVYQSISQQQYSNEQLLRNAKTQLGLYNYVPNQQSFELIKIDFDRSQDEKILKKLLGFANKNRVKYEGYERMPTLAIFGDWNLTQKGKIQVKKQYNYQGNIDLAFFNGFLGYIEDFASQQYIREMIQRQYQKIGISGKCKTYYTLKQAKYVRNGNYSQYAKTIRQVMVPDFALSKVPKYSYIHKQANLEWKAQYSKGERVTILEKNRFGCIATIQKLQDKIAEVKIIQSSYLPIDKPRQYDVNFYTIEYAMEKLDISADVLFAVLDQICVLPNFSKKLLRDFLPDSVNLGLALISQKKMLLTPQFVRCQFQYENSKYPRAIFRKMQLSQKCIELLKEYIEKFGWLIDELQNNPQLIKKNIYAKEIFKEEAQPNVRLFQQYAKLFELKNDGIFYSIYSKISEKQSVQFKKGQQKVGQKVNLQYHQFISKRLAAVSPPSLKAQPQYHDIGDRVIYLRNLQIGCVVGVDDRSIYIVTNERKAPFKVDFTQVFNQKWISSLQKEGPLWNMQVSYYSPTYWRKAIDVQK